MTDGNQVERGIIEVDYRVIEYIIDGVPRYDIVSDAFRTDEFFDTIDDAIEHAYRRLGQ